MFNALARLYHLGGWITECVFLRLIAGSINTVNHQPLHMRFAGVYTTWFVGCFSVIPTLAMLKQELFPTIGPCSCQIFGRLGETCKLSFPRPLACTESNQFKKSLIY